MEECVQGYTSSIKAHVLRLLPEMDLYEELIKYLKIPSNRGFLFIVLSGFIYLV